MFLKCNCVYLLTIVFFSFALCLPDQGKWLLSINQDSPTYIGVAKSLYKDSTVSISVQCTPTVPDTEITIGWVLRQTPCYEEYLAPQLTEAFEYYYKCPSMALESSYSAVRFLKAAVTIEKCTHTIDLKAITTGFQLYETSSPEKCKLQPADSSKSPSRNLRDIDKTDVPKNKEEIEMLPVAQSLKDEKADIKSDPQAKTIQRLEDNIPKEKGSKDNVSAKPVKALPTQSSDHLAVVDQDGVYLLVIYITVSGSDERNFTATLDIKLEGPRGFLSAVDWPLLPFYGFMCGIYVIYALIWLTVSAFQWRDLLRIQFWIGGVIFLGLVEKAVFYAEYQYINSTGQSGHAGMLFAEVLSCLKRTLARLLVIIVSLGFGIVKPRLGPALHRVIGVGALYFTLCSIEGWLRVLKPKNDPSNQTLMAEIPLAVLDSGICWWIFSSLVQTTRTLRLRRNVVKLGLYRHFTNTLIFSVLASVVYMSWSLYNHKLTSCITDWKELWVDEAYWHLLFSLLLLVIMVLWRPTNNNQRYAFTPLLDAIDEEEDLLEKESTNLSDIYGTKTRGNKSQSSAPKKENKNGIQDEDLKWVEENIPSSLTDTALPSLLDSDEEIMTVRFERNKME